MSDDENFLSRWARLKRETARPAPAAPAPADAPPEQPLPPLESLDFASDFTAFLQDKVEESVKRAALKKLFHSPEFNVMDGLDVYIDDYGAPDPIPPEMLSRLAHAREMLFGRDAQQETSPEATSLPRERAPQEQAQGAAAQRPAAGLAEEEAARPALPPAPGD
jgi:hypothetical protein